MQLRPDRGRNVNYLPMRVLVVDQDSSMNEAIARSLRELYTVDAVTTKADCLDLLRSNTFEVIVAGERLEDGSGLELLGQVSKKWPSILRIFAADRHRLRLLKGRLGPFELFQTLAYPIDPERLLATLTLAAAAQDANADTSHIQHVELSGEAQTEDSTASPAPRPEPGATTRNNSGRPAEESRAASSRRTVPRQREAPGHWEIGTDRAVSAQRPASVAGHSSALSRAAGAAPSRGPGTSPSARPGRSRPAARRAPPVRFPPLEPLAAAPEANRPPSSSSRRASDSFAETAAIARSVRSNLELLPDESGSRRMLILIGCGAAVALGMVLLGVKLLGSNGGAPPRPAAAAVHAPEYSYEVTDLVAQIETALKNDDFKGARADVDKLRQLAPLHPRLAFFDNLLAQRNSGSKGGAPESSRAATPGRTTSKRTAQASHHDSVTAPDGSSAKEPDAPPPAKVPATTAAAAATSSEPVLPAEPMLPPETPPGVSRPTAASTTPASVPTSATEAPAPAPAQAPPVAMASPPPAEHAPAPAPAPARRAASDEPPPVIRPEKLIRRVNPDYPSAARHEGIAGSVDLALTISPQGVVKDATVVHSAPSDIFEKSALAAVRKWKYDPKFVDGLPAEAHVTVHLDFGPGM